MTSPPPLSLAHGVVCEVTDSQRAWGGWSSRSVCAHILSLSRTHSNVNSKCFQMLTRGVCAHILSPPGEYASVGSSWCAECASLCACIHNGKNMFCIPLVGLHVRAIYIFVHISNDVITHVTHVRFFFLIFVHISNEVITHVHTHLCELARSVAVQICIHSLYCPPFDFLSPIAPKRPSMSQNRPMWIP